MMYLRTTSFSTNLERIGVTDIGRRSEKVLTAAGVNSIAQYLKTQYGIESCPGLVLLTEFNNLNTSYSKTGRGAEPLPDTDGVKAPSLFPP